MNDERGVSDLVAFVLTFGIIVTSVGTVYMFGVGSLEDLGDSEQIRSVDRTMEGISETMTDVHRRNAPGRSVAIGLDGGTMSVVDDSQLTIVVNTSSGEVRRTVDVGALVIRPNEDAELVYEGGIAYRSQDGGQYVRSDPVISCDGRTTVVDIVEVTGRMSVSVSGSMELSARHASEQTVFPAQSGQWANNATAIEIQIDETRNPDAWRQYFETSPDGWTNTSDGYRCTGIDGVSVRTTTINLDATY